MDIETLLTAARAAGFAMASAGEEETDAYGAPDGKPDTEEPLCEVLVPCPHAPARPLAFPVHNRTSIFYDLLAAFMPSRAAA